MIQHLFPRQYYSRQYLKVERFFIMSLQGKQRRSYSIWCLCELFGFGTASPLNSKVSAQITYQRLEQDRIHSSHDRQPFTSFVKLWMLSHQHGWLLLFMWIFFSPSIDSHCIICYFRLCWFLMARPREEDALFSCIWWWSQTCMELSHYSPDDYCHCHSHNTKFIKRAWRMMIVCAARVEIV